MKIRAAFWAAALAAGLPGQSGAAAPSVPSASQHATTAEIPFDPPLDSKVRYRWEKTEQRDGKTEMSWSVDDFQFEQIDSGYRLIVTPVNSGSNETDPRKLAMMQRLDELTRRPFVLRLNDSGEIEELEDADFYWSTIYTVLREEIGKGAEGKDDLGLREVLENVLAMFQRMPADARQALLTESIQPVVEFADTHTEIGNPLISAVATPSPYGATINRDVTISLQKVTNGRAFLTIISSIPRAELDKLMQAFLKQLTALPVDKRKEAERVTASFEGFRHDTRSDYEVSVDDGLLERFLSTETIEVSGEGKQSRKVTTRSLARVAN